MKYPTTFYSSKIITVKTKKKIKIPFKGDVRKERKSRDSFMCASSASEIEIKAGHVSFKFKF